MSVAPDQENGYFCAWFYVQQILLKSKHSMKELFIYNYIYTVYSVYNNIIYIYIIILGGPEMGVPKMDGL
jgi:hypothetical protein